MLTSASLERDTMTSTQISGAQVIAEALKRLGVEVIFGIVGIPVIEVAEACIAIGIRFISFRNEQSASYAAGYYGYLTGRPGVCLVVGGPGVVHALAGVANAQVNHWPMLLLAGASETFQTGQGAFQELDQVHAVQSYTKYAARPAGLEKVPWTIEKALRTAFYGRPGPTYVDLPSDYIQGKVSSDDIEYALKVPEAPVSLADPQLIKKAVHLLQNAKAPLVIIGKGAAYSRAENQVKKLVETRNFPFLPTPMAKGVISDTHPLCVAAARSQALAEADVVLVLGARLNWILHYGAEPKFKKDVKIIHVDISPEELNNNRTAEVALLGHLPAVVEQLISGFSAPALSSSNAYLAALVKKVRTNAEKIAPKYNEDKIPMTYHRVFGEIKARLPTDGSVFIVSEGANTMDIGRSVFDQYTPRRRLDAATFATMGVGMGAAIAAQAYDPKGKVVMIVGDSAFGFSAMEVETAARNQYPLIIFVINNNGVYRGLDQEAFDKLPREQLPSTQLGVDTRYDLIGQACGAKGVLVRTPDELKAATKAALSETKIPTVINVLIKPGGNKKLEFGWLASTKKKAKI